MEMEEIVRLATTIVLKQGYHAPQLLVWGERGAGSVLCADFPNEYEEKLAYMFTAGKHTRLKHDIGMLKRVFFVVEVWAMKHENGTPFIRPHLHPKRKEMLHIACLDLRTKEHTSSCLEYIRDTDNNLVELKRVIFPDGTKVAKTESELLPMFVTGYTR
jgi:hypothetical protein